MRPENLPASLAGDEDVAAVLAARRGGIARIEQAVALVVAALIVPLLALVYGGLAAIGYMVGLTLALVAERVFVGAMRLRIGPERATPADVLTLVRAAVAALLAGLVVSGIRDRMGLAGWLAFGAALLAATALDWLDGPLARRLGPTKLGAVLDIEADSWLTLWCAAATVAWGGLPWIVLLPPLAHYLHPALALRRGALPRGGGPWWARVVGVAQMALLLAALLPLAGTWRAALPVLAWPIATVALVVMLATLAVRAPAPREGTKGAGRNAG
ncbi:MAG TPA: CDP-alcohol phosphatidyltransferase family protein [Ktedonobacterales bacterium]